LYEGNRYIVASLVLPRHERPIIRCIGLLYKTRIKAPERRNIPLALKQRNELGEKRNELGEKRNSGAKADVTNADGQGMIDNLNGMQSPFGIGGKRPR
jgi:hypothetical protein